MQATPYALRLIDQELGGLIHRLQMVKPLAMHETMVPAAIPRNSALAHIDRYLLQGRGKLLTNAHRFKQWLRSSQARASRGESIYRRFVFLRLQASAALTQFDLFADAITQRSESGIGILLRGMEYLAEDALHIQDTPYTPPPMLCYLDHGIGAAIRRARTRLPGGGENPVALIRVPRERMVGLGIASSLVHEVGHQGAALLNLVPTLQAAMQPLLHGPGLALNPWQSWHRWVSEIVADLWSVSRVGMASTLGLINVVSLPRPFVFRANLDDPHPTPWLRVLLSAEMGRQLYPHDEWQRLRTTWQQMYPGHRHDVEQRDVMHALAEHIPLFVHWLLRQPVPAANYRTLRDLLFDPALGSHALHNRFEQWEQSPRLVDAMRPCQVFALAAYARLVRGKGSQAESHNLHRLLHRWALQA